MSPARAAALFLLTFLTALTLFALLGGGDTPTPARVHHLSNTYRGDMP